MERIEFKVEGMSCGHCRMAVENALKTLDGVSDVNVDLDSGIVTVEYEAAGDRENLKNAITDAGYTVVES